jgi:protein phosphatase
MIPAERAHLNVAAVSDPGISGKKNEDRLHVSAFSTPQDPTLPSLLGIIADGIGGHRAGEIAAEIAIETIAQVVAASDASQPILTLHEAIQQASQAIYQQAQSEPSQRGMGSTCACCWVIGDRLYTATVGDSRIYLVRNGAIQQISTDHTWVQEAIDGGMLSVSQARRHPNAHVIRRYLGSRQPAIPDLRLKLNNLENDRQSETNQGFALKPDDRLLLCSDGLTDLVEDHEILDYLQSRPLETALQQLVLLSNQRGGHDNITIIGMHIPKPTGSPPPVPPVENRKRKWGTACAVLAGIAVIAALLIASLAFGVWNLSGPKVTSTPAGLSSPAPAILPTSEFYPTPPGTQAVHPTPSPAQTRANEPTPHSATLTPWPTNTLQP